MNSKKFQYYVLKYRPSLLLDERVNIGLLFVFEDDSLQFRFVYPKNLQRLSNLYKNVNLDHIASYLNIFEQNAIKLSGQVVLLSKIDSTHKHLKDFFIKEVYDNKILISDVSKIIANEFLLPDSNSLFFTKSSYGEYDNIEGIVKYYRKRYFETYDLIANQSSEATSNKNYLIEENTIKTRIKNEYLVSETDFFVQKEEKHNEKYLVSLLDKTLRLKANNEQDLSLFEKNYKIEGKLVTTKFDYIWQNGTANLVKSISLDLKQKRSIQQKSVRWYGELSQLTANSKINNYRFDLLVSRPKNKQLFTAYDKALKVLENIETNKKIIEENDIEEYAVEALKSIKPLQSFILK